MRQQANRRSIPSTRAKTVTHVLEFVVVERSSRWRNRDRTCRIYISGSNHNDPDYRCILPRLYRAYSNPAVVTARPARATAMPQIAIDATRAGSAQRPHKTKDVVEFK